MLERKWLGDKTKGGFYKKSAGRAPRRQWRQRRRTPGAGLEDAGISSAPEAEVPCSRHGEKHRGPGARLRTLLGLEGSPSKGDKAGAFLWSVLSDLWNYSANRIPEISDSIVEIDRAMRLGFNWKLGPFELWDAAGVEATVARMKKEGQTVAANVEQLLAGGKKSWYTDDPKAASGRVYFDLRTAKYEAGEGSRRRVVG